MLDRIRHGTIPASTARDALAQQAAALAANLAAAPQRWAEFRHRLLALGTDDPKRLVLAALALGWSEKWKNSLGPAATSWAAAELRRSREIHSPGTS